MRWPPTRMELHHGAATPRRRRSPRHAGQWRDGHQSHDHMSSSPSARRWTPHPSRPARSSCATASSALVAATVSYSATTKRATFNPRGAGRWTGYTVTVRGGSTGVHDTAGNVLAADSVWSFTTVPDTTAPTVSSITPSSGATSVSRTGNVTATFSEGMNAATINSSTFELRGPGGTLVPAAVTYSASNRRATLNPNATLAGLTTYTATVRGGSSDPRVKCSLKSSQQR